MNNLKLFTGAFTPTARLRLRVCRLQSRPRSIFELASVLAIAAALTTSMLTSPGIAADVDGVPSEFPAGVLGETVRLGEALVNTTSEHPLSKLFIGNSLNCTSCHLDGGRHPEAASFIGVASAYPAFSPRENKVITLEDRILNCFIRSQNGKRPPNGSPVPVAIATYITWLSTGAPLKMNPAKSLGPNHLKMMDVDRYTPDLSRGASLYEERCADCHGDDGLGNDEGPPVWGESSFNDGAGLSKLAKMASWLKVAMPLDDTDLTEQESVDIAAFVNSHRRPHFSAELAPVEQAPAKHAPTTKDSASPH